MPAMNDEFYREQIMRIRALAREADPFIKRRLLDLAGTYESKIGQKPRAPLPLPSITHDGGPKR